MTNYEDKVQKLGNELRVRGVKNTYSYLTKFRIRLFNGERFNDLDIKNLAISIAKNYKENNQ